jgi:hypothetical protein
MLEIGEFPIPFHKQIAESHVEHSKSIICIEHLNKKKYCGKKKHNSYNVGDQKATVYTDVDGNSE